MRLLYPPPFAPKLQLQHPLTSPNTCLPLVCLKTQTQEFDMAVHIPWYRFVGDSSWCNCCNTFFAREASLCGKSECNKLQAPPEQSSGIYKDLWRTAGQLSRSPLALTWLLNRAVLGWQSHIYGLFIPAWAVFCYPMPGGAALWWQWWWNIKKALTGRNIACLWIAAARERCDPRSLLCHCLGRMLENCSRGSGPCELLVLNSWQWERAGLLQELLRQEMRRQCQTLQYQGHIITWRLSTS